MTAGAAVLDGSCVRLTDASRFVRVLEVQGDARPRIDLIDDPRDRAAGYSPWYGELRHGVTVRVSVDVDGPVWLLTIVRDPDVTVRRLPGRAGEIVCAIEHGHVRRVVAVRLDRFAVRSGGRTIAGGEQAKGASRPAGPVSMEWLDEIE